MSFFVKTGEDNDKRIAMVKRKYFRDILEYNLSIQEQKQKMNQQLRDQNNNKYSKINLEAIEQLQYQMKRKQMEKIEKQEALRKEYEKQIEEKRRRIYSEKEKEKRYVKLQTENEEENSEKRMRQLMRIYNTKSNFKVIPQQLKQRRVRTEISELAQQKNSNFVKQIQSQQRYLPPIDSSVAKIEKAKEECQINQEDNLLKSRNKKMREPRLLF